MNIDKERLEKGLYWQRAWKLVEGCTKVSPGCDNCWSEQETVMRSNHPNDKIYERAKTALDCFNSKFSGHITMRQDNLNLPLRTKKPTVFSIWNDLYHEDVADEFRDRAYAVMALRPQHMFLVLTKRAEKMSRFFSDKRWRAYLHGIDDDNYGFEVHDELPAPGAFRGPWPLPNVWHGVTSENQEQADLRIPHLLRVPGKRFISIEPMLGPVDFGLSCGCYSGCSHEYCTPFEIDAVLLGGESGKNARPMHPDWVHSVCGQCLQSGVPFFFKQWGEWIVASDFNLLKHHKQWDMRRDDCLFLDINGRTNDNSAHGISADGFAMIRVGKKKAGRTLEGKLHDDLPWLQNQTIKEQACL